MGEKGNKDLERLAAAIWEKRQAVREAREARDQELPPWAASHSWKTFYSTQLVVDDEGVVSRRCEWPIDLLERWVYAAERGSKFAALRLALAMKQYLNDPESALPDPLRRYFAGAFGEIVDQIPVGKALGTHVGNRSKDENADRDWWIWERMHELKAADEIDGLERSNLARAEDICAVLEKFSEGEKTISAATVCNIAAKLDKELARQ